MSDKLNPQEGVEFLFQAFLGFARRRSYLLVWTVWLLLCLEFFSRASLSKTVQWVVQHFPVFLLNSVLVGSLLLLAIGLTGWPRFAFWIVGITTVLLAAVSGIKQKILGVPLLPADYRLLSETQDVVSLRDAVSLQAVLGVLCFFALGFLMARLCVRRRVGVRERVALLLVSACLIGAVYADRPVSISPIFGAAAIPWDQAQNVRINGFLLSALMNSRDLGQVHLAPGDPQAVAALAARRVQGVPGGVRPNLILVLSESFWDPTRLPGATLSPDPIPFYRALAANHPSGTMLSPQFGGGTANVEFEVLTGLSTRFLPQGVTPYNQYINRPVDSLASILSRQGYTATAISPWPNWFFNSRMVYRNLGFGKLISVEFMRWVFSGPNIPDSEVARLITVETAKTPGPDFVFANTGENHYPYDPGKFSTTSIAVDGLPPAASGLLETYAQGCSQADRMLRQLVEYYQASGEPTVLVFFGDHLPTLGEDYLVYKQAGYITGEEDPDFLNKIYRVPVLVWSNYLPERRETIDLSPSFLAPYLLERMELPGTPVTDYLRELSHELPVIPPKHRWADFKVDEGRLVTYEALENDILFGDQQAYGDWRHQIVNPQFQLGPGPIVIESVSARGDQVTLFGKNLPPRGVVYLGEAALPTTWVSEEKMTAKLPSFRNKEDVLPVQIRLSDTNKTVVGESNLFSLTVARKE